MVNVLTRVGRMRQVEAVGTGLPTQILTNTIGGATFAAAGLVDPLAAVTLGGASMIGSAAGVRLGNKMSEGQSRGVLGGFMMALAPIIALSPLLKKQDELGAEQLSQCDFEKGSSGEVTEVSRNDAEMLAKEEEEEEDWAVQWRMERIWQEAQHRGPMAVGQLLGMGTLVGVISGTLGVGATPVMIAYLALTNGLNKVSEYKVCVGTALVAVTPNVTMGSISHAFMGSMQWRMVPVLGAGTAIGALCGSSIALYIPNTIMQQVFAGFCGVTGLAMLRRAPFMKNILRRR